MSSTTKAIVQYITYAMRNGDFETVTDRKGVPFARVNSLFIPADEQLVIKSASVYIRKNECVQILANIGGFNLKTRKNWSRSTVLLVKPINEFSSVVIERRKMSHLVCRDDMDQLILSVMTRDSV